MTPAHATRARHCCVSKGFSYLISYPPPLQVDRWDGLEPLEVVFGGSEQQPYHNNMRCRLAMIVDKPLAIRFTFELFQLEYFDRMRVESGYRSLLGPVMLQDDVMGYTGPPGDNVRKSGVINGCGPMLELYFVSDYIGVDAGFNGAVLSCH